MRGRGVKKPPPRIPTLALTPAQAAQSLGVGEDFLRERVLPELRVIRRGRKVLIPTAELENWLTANCEAPAVEQMGGAR